jgi:hypothetical protein
LSVREILSGQWLALQRQFMGPLIIVLIAGCVFTEAIAKDVAALERVGWYCLGIAWAIMLVVDCIALYWVGMWQALTAKNPNRAASGSILRIMILPWVVFALVMLLVALASMVHEPDLGWGFFLGLWVFLGIAADLGFGGWARLKLLTEFRSVATERYDQKGKWRLKR